MVEEWRPVVGYEGLYEVSNTGKVRSLKRNRLLSVFNNNGYSIVYLCFNYKKKGVYLHRLVAQAFIPNTEGLPEVNHRDEDKSNNNVENLEWCNRKYNMNYGSRSEKVRDKMIKKGYWTGLSRKEYKRRWSEENYDNIKEKNRKWIENNREKVRLYHKEYMKMYRHKNESNI